MDKFGRVIAFAIIEQDEELVCLPFYIRDGKINKWSFATSDSYQVVPAPPGVIVAFDDETKEDYVILADPVSQGEFNAKNKTNVLRGDQWLVSSVVDTFSRKPIDHNNEEKK